jgi:predicted CoA-binding protein
VAVKTISPDLILEASRSILLVDWPSTAVPRALLAARFTVFGYSPTGYSKAEVLPDVPVEDNLAGVFPPRSAGEAGYLVFRRLNGRPSSADIVCVYRPAEELPGILADHVLPLGARAVWFLRPVTSAEERRLLTESNLDFVENADIAELARSGRRPT